MKKAIRCTTAGFLVVLSLLFTVISGEYAALPDQFHVTRGDTFSLPGSANDGVSVDASAAQRVGVQDNYEVNISPVSYTHLDVYKRQLIHGAQPSRLYPVLLKHCRQRAFNLNG